MNISARKLAQICQVFSGKGAKELVDQRIMSEAKRLLQFSSFTIKEIADGLNYSDQYQFSKFFKKHKQALLRLLFSQFNSRIGKVNYSVTFLVLS